MPKIKIHQATAKRIRTTRTKKMLHRASGQDHFNSRESGKITRNKRRDKGLYFAFHRTVRTVLAA